MKSRVAVAALLVLMFPAIGGALPPGAEPRPPDALIETSVGAFRLAPEYQSPRLNPLCTPPVPPGTTPPPGSVIVACTLDDPFSGAQQVAAQSLPWAINLRVHPRESIRVTLGYEPVSIEGGGFGRGPLTLVDRASGRLLWQLGRKQSRPACAALTAVNTHRVTLRYSFCFRVRAR